MNNPLEAVTQAVNSLVTALKLPDESAKANEVLGEMSFPQFSRLLPYRDYNQESGLFMNDTTMGFMLEAIPINGANESIVEALDHMLRTKLPRGIPLCIHLMSSQLVGDRIEYGLREFSWSGEQAERFNAIKVPDTANPSMPIQICPAPPLFRRIGLAIGYWEPMALTDVTRSPGCMVTRRTHGDVNVGTACRHPYDTGNVRPFHGGAGLCRRG